MKIKGRLFTLLVLSLMAVSYQNCSKTNSVLSGSAIDKNLVQASLSESLVTVSYFRGGWMSVSGQPNFSNDMVLSYLDSGQVNGFALDPVTNCQKFGILSSEQKQTLGELINSLSLVLAKDSEVIPILDGGDEKVVLTYQTGHQKIIHLIKSPAQTSEYYLKSPSDISEFLQNLDASLASMTCK